MNVLVDAQHRRAAAAVQRFRQRGRRRHGRVRRRQEGQREVDRRARSSPTTCCVPPTITTYDMKGNLARMTRRAERRQRSARRRATSPATPTTYWTDSTVVDAHVYAGLVLRLPLQAVRPAGTRQPRSAHAAVHAPGAASRISGPPRPTSSAPTTSTPSSAATCGPDGRGAVVVRRRRAARYLSRNDRREAVLRRARRRRARADPRRHRELGPTQRLPVQRGRRAERGFSDMFGVVDRVLLSSRPATRALQASLYCTGKDLTVPARRSFAIALSHGEPAVRPAIPTTTPLRFIGGDPHYNSTIASHAFYLAIEGGTNRTSGRSVQGVGAANRDQIEKIILPGADRADAVELDVRADARRDDSGGARSLRRRQRRRARDHAGVGRGRRAGAHGADGRRCCRIRRSPVATTLQQRSLTSPQWVLGVTASAGSSNLRITQWTFDVFDHAGRASITRCYSAVHVRVSSSRPAARAARRSLAQTDACAAICCRPQPERRPGAAQITFTAIDDAGSTVTFCDAAHDAAGEVRTCDDRSCHRVLIARPGDARCGADAAHGSDAPGRDRGYVNISGWLSAGPRASRIPSGRSTLPSRRWSTPATRPDGSRASTPAAASASGGTSRSALDVLVVRRRARPARCPRRFRIRSSSIARGPSRATPRAQRATRRRVHLQALWMVPLRRPMAARARRRTVVVFSVGQDLVSDVTVTQTYPYDTATLRAARPPCTARAHGSGSTPAPTSPTCLRPHVGLGVRRDVLARLGPAR